jgi:hypothetical protein
MNLVSGLGVAKCQRGSESLNPTPADNVVFSRWFLPWETLDSPPPNRQNTSMSQPGWEKQPGCNNLVPGA